MKNSLSSFFLFLIMSGMSHCSQAAPSALLAPTNTATRSTSTPTLDFTLTPIPQPTAMPIKTLAFYGDSSLAIGEAGDGIPHVGFSFTTDLRNHLDPFYTIFVLNYGGRTARWAYENMETILLPLNPDLVTLWWGFDDLGGCPGIFDRDTNALIGYKLDSIIKIHIQYMTYMLDYLTASGIVVIIMTPIPVYGGQLPWSHLDEENNIVWEEGHWCHFNEGLVKLVEAQQELVDHYYSDNGLPVYLVNTWQLFTNNPDTEKMYMDIVHPGSTGAKLIADEWFFVFSTIKR